MESYNFEEYIKKVFPNLYKIISEYEKILRGLEEGFVFSPLYRKFIKKIINEEDYPSLFIFSLETNKIEAKYQRMNEARIFERRYDECGVPVGGLIRGKFYYDLLLEKFSQMDIDKVAGIFVNKIFLNYEIVTRHLEFGLLESFLSDVFSLAWKECEVHYQKNFPQKNLPLFEKVVDEDGFLLAWAPNPLLEEEIKVSLRALNEQILKTLKKRGENKK